TQITKAVDPWAGSYYVEYLTQEIAKKAWALIEEVEELGGMAKAIETGVPKMRIEEASARKQARLDSGQDILVGVNKFRTKEKSNIEILEVDNTVVRDSQIERLKKLRANRDQSIVDTKLSALSKCAETGKGNLLELAVEAAENFATLGEISDALEVHFGRHKADTKLISGVYSKEVENDSTFAKAQKLADKFAETEGRRPRVMIAKMGQDGHDRGAKVVASSFADLGFDVDMGSLFQTPEEVAKQAIENDVHFIGASSLAAGHKTLIPQLIGELEKLGRPDIMVFAGGVIPEQDYDYLLERKVAAIFGPGSVISESAITIMEKYLEQA
ncbi:MAG: cobalamin-dependent protein, partial [Maribacter sp.]|nr:cobalamin-dependent protein [Maribacter sp.]